MNNFISVGSKEIGRGLYLQCKDSKWGLVDRSGNAIIPIQYDTISIQDWGGDKKEFKCGYGGVFVSGLYCRKEMKVIYTGIYDVYDEEGIFLIGGISDYVFDMETQTYRILVGRSYVYYPKRFTSHGLINIGRSGKWCLLSADLCTFKSTIMKTRKYKGRKIAGLEEIPEGLLFSHIENKKSNIILGIEKNNKCLMYTNGLCMTSPYTNVRVIDEHFSFVYNGKIGLVKDGILILPCDFYYITYPVDGWVFLVLPYPFTPDKEKEGKFFTILYRLQRDASYYYFGRAYAMTAVECVDKEQIDMLINAGAFKLHIIGNDKNSMKSFTIAQKYSHYFSAEFLSKLGMPISIEEKYYNVGVSISAIKPYDLPKFTEYEPYGLMDVLDGDPSAYWNID